MIRPRILSIEGNIGAGKSTFLASLQEKYKYNKNILFLPEPVSEWEKFVDENGKNMLEKFYQDQSTYSFAFQVMAFSTRLAILRNAVDNAENNGIDTIVMERSLEADREIFAKMLYQDKLMEKCEHEIYLKMAENALKDYSLDGIIWINVPPEICLKRIEKRNREGEQSITLEYLEKCHNCHNVWLDGNGDFTFQIRDSKSSDPTFWKSIHNYLL